MPNVKIVVCTTFYDPEWRWLEANLNAAKISFEFTKLVDHGFLRKMFPVNIARLHASLEAVKLARRTGAKAVVAHGPTLAAWCAIFAQMLDLRIPILAHSFNFTTLPSLMKRYVFSFAFSRIDRFVVFSSVERALYAKAFWLSAEKFDVVLWGVKPPHVDSLEMPLEGGDYICAIGGNARDYATLLESARQLPELRFVVVVRPESLRGLDIPPNVSVRTNLPIGMAMNILMYSRFMVLPLVNSEVPCGHVTLVAAMHLAKALIITDSLGVSDYVRHDNNALTVPAASANELTAAIKRLWTDSALCGRLGENGKKFATKECTEERIAQHFLKWLQSRGLLTDK
jgi:glycosyltransferase involved in cell wall biosynthesis